MPRFGELGVTYIYTVYLWLVGKRVIDFPLVLIKLFSPALMSEELWADIGLNCGVTKGWVTLSAHFKGIGWSSTNDCWHQKTRVPGLSRGVVCLIRRLAVLIQ